MVSTKRIGFMPGLLSRLPLRSTVVAILQAAGLLFLLLGATHIDKRLFPLRLPEEAALLPCSHSKVREIALGKSLFQRGNLLGITEGSRTRTELICLVEHLGQDGQRYQTPMIFTIKDNTLQQTWGPMERL
jgi:hypothetical protein